MSEDSSTSAHPPIGIFLMAHGAPNSVVDIPIYLKKIRGGVESSPEVVRLIRDRYEAIGGSSPLLEITQGQAAALEKFISPDGKDFKVYFGMRNWTPYIEDGVRKMLNDGVRKVLAICLAPQYSKWSTERYFQSFKDALNACDVQDVEVRYVSSWSNHPCLIDAFAERYNEAINRLKQMGKDRVHTIFTAHSIPASSLDEGDPYAEEYERTLQGVVERVQPHRWYRAYQSQGMIPVPWLGPSVETVLDKIARYGPRTVLVVPVGFVSDHIEVLYDIDVGFKKYARERKLDLHRTESMNLSPRFIEAMAAVAWEHLV